MPKNVLVLTPRLPYPIIGGDKLRIYNVCKSLVKAGYDLTLLSLVADSNESELATKHESSKIFSLVETIVLSKPQSYINSFLGLLRGESLQTSYYKSKLMQKKVDELLDSERYQCALVHLTRMAPYVEKRKGIRKVLEMTDAVSLNYNRSRKFGVKGFLSLVYRAEESRARKYETECLENFDTTVVVSPIDKDWLLKNNPLYGQKIKVIPLSISDDFFDFTPPDDYDQNLIVFIGNMRTYQNEDAVRYFVSDIYPIIKKVLPLSKFRVIGSEPSNFIKSLNGKDGIEITGKVVDVKTLACKACVSICPMRIGAGIQTKILEAMSLGVPVVASLNASSGIIGAKNNEHYFVVDKPGEFADKILSLMQNKELRSRISQSGKEFVTNWNKNIPNYSILF